MFFIKKSLHGGTRLEIHFQLGFKLLVDLVIILLFVLGPGAE